MLPNRFANRAGTRKERANIPVWVMVSGGIAAVILAVFVWVTMGIGATPSPESVTVDLPVRM